ncbi:hypothetical protein PTI98_013648 [Pleurotus ostreatus]|nr:hypothetical protein PTI98_013648 [Pleurotus ostreatus]
MSLSNLEDSTRPSSWEMAGNSHSGITIRLPFYVLRISHGYVRHSADNSRGTVSDTVRNQDDPFLLYGTVRKGSQGVKGALNPWGCGGSLKRTNCESPCVRVMGRTQSGSTFEPPRLAVSCLYMDGSMSAVYSE